MPQLSQQYINQPPLQHEVDSELHAVNAESFRQLKLRGTSMSSSQFGILQSKHFSQDEIFLEMFIGKYWFQPTSTHGTV